MASIRTLHACLRVENLEASQKFYEEAFGFKETRRKDYPEHKFTLVYLALPGDEFEIELTYNYDHGPYVVGMASRIWPSHQMTLKEIMLNIRHLVTKLLIYLDCLGIQVITTL